MPTDFDKIVFDPKSHTYKCGQKLLMPVTSTIKWVTPEFNSDEVVASKMAETGRSREDILAEWDAKRDFGLDRGTRVHTYIENVIDDNELDVFLAVNDHIHEMKQFDKAWMKMKNELGIKLFKKEWTIGDEELGIAGRCDAVFEIDKDGKSTKALFDWKTGKFMLRKYARESMLPPFNDLPACEEVKYSLQLSLYKLLIERNTDIKISGGYILHLPDGFDYQLFNTLDLSERAEKWLLDMNANGTFGDPELEKKANKAAKPLDGFDADALKMMSPNSRKNLLGKAAKLLQRGKQYLNELI